MSKALNNMTDMLELLCNATVDMNCTGTGNATDNFSAPLLKKTGKEWVNTFFRFGVPSFLVIMMFSIGCNVELEALKRHIRKPIGVGVCLLWQYVLLPAVGFGIANATIDNRFTALGFITITTLPSGSMSNMFAYWFGGDIPLSISMTTVSTICAFGTIPLNMFLYGRTWTDDTLKVPFINLVVSLAIIIFPVAIGMVIKAKLPRVAGVILKIGSIIGMVSFVLLVSLQVYAYHSFFLQPWSVWFCLLLLPLLSLSAGFIMTSVAGLPMDQRKSVIIECASQNVALGITIAILSFPVKVSVQLMGILLMFGIIIIVFFSVLILSTNIFILLKKRFGNSGSTDARPGKTNDNVNGVSVEKSEEALPFNKDN